MIGNPFARRLPEREDPAVKWIFLAFLLAYLAIAAVAFGIWNPA